MSGTGGPGAGAGTGLGGGRGRAAAPGRVTVLSDTHLADGAPGRLPPAVYQHLQGADLVLHAGDVTGRSLLAELESFAPVCAVRGNNDVDLGGLLPDRLEFGFGGVAVGMVHDGGRAEGRPARLRRAFPAADVVVFGHSHIPVCSEGLEGQLLFNPGSPTQRRRQPHRTIGLLTVASGRVVQADIVPVD